MTATCGQPARRVRWTYRFTAESFPPRAMDDHVRIGGPHFDLLDTVYTLQPEGGGTRLKVSMSYRVSTQFNWYAEPLARWLIGNFEKVALRLYARRAEAGAAQGQPGPAHPRTRRPEIALREGARAARFSVVIVALPETCGLRIRTSRCQITSRWPDLTNVTPFWKSRHRA